MLASMLVATMQANCEIVNDGAVVVCSGCRITPRYIPSCSLCSLLKLSVITVISPINRLARAAPLALFDPTFPRIFSTYPTGELRERQASQTRLCLPDDAAFEQPLSVTLIRFRICTRHPLPMYVPARYSHPP